MGCPVWILSHPCSGAGASPALFHCLKVKVPLGSLWEQRSAALSSAGRPQLGPSVLYRAWQGERDRKTELGSSPSLAGAAEGLPRAAPQGEERQHSWELCGSKLPGPEPGTSAPDGPARGRASCSSPSLAEHRQAVLKGSQCSGVFPAPLPCISRLHVASLWHQCVGGIFPQSLASVLLPRTTLPGVPPACLLPPACVNLWGQRWGTWIIPLPSCAECTQGASSPAVAEPRLRRWFPASGAGPGCGGNPCRLDCPCVLQLVPTPSPGRLGHLSPSSRSCWTEEPLCSPSGEVPGTCWGDFSFPREGFLATAGPCPMSQSRPSPSTACPAAPGEAGEISQGSGPWGQLCVGLGELPRVQEEVRGLPGACPSGKYHPGSVTLALGHLPRRGLAVPGGCLAGLGCDESVAQPGGEWVTLWVWGQDSCDILGTPAGLGLNQCGLAAGWSNWWFLLDSTAPGHIQREGARLVA